MKRYSGTLIFTHAAADTMAVKAQGGTVSNLTFTGGTAVLLGATAGSYFAQYYLNSEVLDEQNFTVEQRLSDAPADYIDPVTRLKTTIEAIYAYLEGRATSQQRSIQVGDKRIEYSTLDQLKAWKTYFEDELRKAEGKPAQVRNEKIYYKGI